MIEAIQTALRYVNEHPGEALVSAVCLIVIVGGLLLLPFAATAPLIQ